MALPPDPVDDLVRRARRGDREAAAELLRGLQHTIYRFALAQLRDEEAAREATQETAVRILQGIQRFSGRSRLTTWALGVTLNVCRERRRKRPLAACELSLVADDASAPADSLVDSADDARRLRQEIDRLPARQREAVVLRYFEQLSVRETAESMGCSEGAVKASLWQGLRKLKEALGATIEGGAVR